ncbi:MAG: hypothetical protein AAGI52_14035 [Bacteroidota bacterium]
MRSRLPLAVGVAASGLYLLTLTPNLALAHDAAGYLASIQSGQADELAHPHHLLYNAVAALWLKLFGWIGLPPAQTVASLNALAGGACVGLIAALLRDRGGVPTRLALGAAAAAGVSFGLWFYSVAVEVYVIPLAFLLATLYVLLGPPSSRQIVTVGVLHGLAMLFHQVHVLFGVVVLVVLWRRRSEIPWIRRAATYVVAGSVIVIGGYGAALAFAVDAHSIEEAWVWFTLYAQDDSYLHPVALSTAAKATVGFVRSIVGGHFGFAMESVQSLLLRAFPDKMLDDETFLVSGLPGWLPPLLLGLGALAGAGSATLAITAARRRGPATTTGRDLRAALATWIGLYAVFFFFWDPFNVEFWIPQTTALWMLVALGLTDREGQVPTWSVRTMGAVAALLLLVNGLGTIAPARDASRDVFAARLAPLAETVGPGDLVVVPSAHITKSYVTLNLGAETVGVAQTIRPNAEAAPVPPTEAADAILARVHEARQRGTRVAIAMAVVTPDETTLRIYGPDVDAAAQSLRERLPPFDAEAGGPISRFGLYVPESAEGPQISR